jgi:hypothetical protein
MAQAAFMAPAMMSQSAIVTDAGNTTAGASGTVVPDADCDASVTSLFNFFANQYAAQGNMGAQLQL